MSGSTSDYYCGSCGMSHVGDDCGPDPDGSYPCEYGHFGCSYKNAGPCSNEHALLAGEEED